MVGLGCACGYVAETFTSAGNHGYGIGVYGVGRFCHYYYRTWAATESVPFGAVVAHAHYFDTTCWQVKEAASLSERDFGAD